jgi:hypothetical protein
MDYPMDLADAQKEIKSLRRRIDELEHERDEARAEVERLRALNSCGGEKMNIKCFMLEPTERAVRSLRRYVGESTCPGPGMYTYHNAEVVIEHGVSFPTGNLTLYGSSDDSWPHDDPRWPTRCAQCAREFKDNDHWQHNLDRLFGRTDGGADVTIKEAPAGAIWDAHWWPVVKDRGPDGRCLVVKTPGGDWMIDCPSTSGGRWTRTGTPPKITVTPSILLSDYHGWLRGGELVPA